MLLAAVALEVGAASQTLPILSATLLGDLPSPPGLPIRMPTDVAVGPEGRIYVVDSGNGRVLAYEVDGRFAFAFGAKAPIPGQLLAPVGIDVSPEGRVLVVDREGRRVQVFDRDGGFVRTIATRFGDRDEEPVDVAADRSGRVLVTVSAPGDAVLVFDQHGNPVGHWGGTGNGAGKFRYPATIASDRDGRSYVVDVLNGRVQVFDPKGEYLMRIGSWGVTPGQLYRPKGVALRPNGALVVSDGYLGVVQSFSRNGHFRGIVGRDGEIGRFDTPAGLAVDSRDRLYVVEMLANKVSVWQLRQ
jgi:DNA-binding beta-propeller fold protein YncE